MSSGSPILLKIVSENQLSEKTFFIQLPPARGVQEVGAGVGDGRQVGHVGRMEAAHEAEGPQEDIREFLSGKISCLRQLSQFIVFLCKKLSCLIVCMYVGMVTSGQ